MSQRTNEQQWMQPPAGMQIVKDGVVQRGDYFYIAELGAWGPVPRSGWGEPILNSLVARGPIDWNEIEAL